MNVQRQENDLIVELENYCGIACVEEHTESFKDILCSDESISSLCLDCRLVEECDTAYVQLLLVLKQHMKDHEGFFIVKDMPPCMSDLLECYGLQLA